jgi:hypothetical protein
VNRDFRDMLSALSETQAEYMIVGAHAVAAYGRPRATGDLDIWIRATRENASRVLEALKRFGAPLFDLTLEDLSQPGIVFQIGVVPQRIDILTKISGVDFESAWSNRTELEVEGMRIPFIGRKDLLGNKRAAARPSAAGDLSARRNSNVCFGASERRQSRRVTYVSLQPLSWRLRSPVRVTHRTSSPGLPRS